MRIFVTGGAGLIGQAAVDRLVRQGHHVVALLRRVPEPPPHFLPASEQMVGDAQDTAKLRQLVAGTDAVLHLAAIPSPVGHTASELVAANSVTTMAVLEAAGEAGIRRVAIASSISILGLAWSAQQLAPEYLPIDEEHPLKPTEGYALSKEDDEAACRMAARRWGMSVMALRFPFTQSQSAIIQRRDDPANATQLAKELWAYLDLRDAARVCELALTADLGVQGQALVVNAVADDVLSHESLASLVHRWYPALESGLQHYAGAGAYSTRVATERLGFTAEYLLEG